MNTPDWEPLAPHPGYALLELNLEQVSEFVALPAIRDPMDRLIRAAARAVRARLVSGDGALAGPGVERLWDRATGRSRRCSPISSAG